MSKQYPFSPLPRPCIQCLPAVGTSPANTAGPPGPGAHTCGRPHGSASARSKDTGVKGGPPRTLGVWPQGWGKRQGHWGGAIEDSQRPKSESGNHLCIYSPGVRAATGASLPLDVWLPAVRGAWKVKYWPGALKSFFLLRASGNGAGGGSPFGGKREEGGW